MHDTGFNLNASADRALVAGIAGLVLFFIGFFCGGAFLLPYALLPFAAISSGLAVYFGRMGLTEVRAQILPPEMHGRATAGLVMGIVGLVFSLCWLVMCCLGIVLFALIMITGNL